MDYIDPAVGIPLAIILWTIVLIIFLVQLRRSKIARDKKREAERSIRRRENYIAASNEAEEAYSESLKNNYTPRQRVYRKPYGDK